MRGWAEEQRPRARAEPAWQRKAQTVKKTREGWILAASILAQLGSDRAAPAGYTDFALDGADGLGWNLQELDSDTDTG